MVSSLGVPVFRVNTVYMYLFQQPPVVIGQARFGSRETV